MAFVHSLVKTQDGTKGWCAPLELGEATPHYISFVIPVDDRKTFFAEYTCETITRAKRAQRIESHDLVMRGEDSFVLHFDKQDVWFAVKPGPKKDRRLPYVGTLQHDDFRYQFTEIEPEDPDELDRIYDTENLFVIGCEPFAHYSGIKSVTPPKREKQPANRTTSAPPGSAQRHSIRKACNLAIVRSFCNVLIEKRKGKTLGDEILRDLGTGYIGETTYRRLSRWCNPAHSEPAVQPVAEALSKELFGHVISRVA